MQDHRVLNTAIIGCGKIARDHLWAIKHRCGDVAISFCDRNMDVAATLARSSGFAAEVYDSVESLFKKRQYDIVHILTPPTSHYDLATLALDHGANVFIEKPMTFTHAQAKSLFDSAERKNRLLCVGHSLLFMQCYLKAVNLIKQKKYGDILSVYCFFGHSEKKKTIPYGGVSHWAYKMPGGPLLNLVSHPASVIVDLIGVPDEIRCELCARHLMPFGMSDLLHMVIKNKTTIGTMMISMAHGSSARYIMIECQKGSIYVDLAKQICVSFKNKGKFGPISKALIGIGQSWDFLKETVNVTSQVVLGKIKQNPGTIELVTRFYKAVREHAQSPISRENACGVEMIIDTFIRTSNDERAVQLGS
jgi:predicted dehydrogenase